jgi:hypothetical protein
MIKPILAVHIAAGSVSLASMLIPMVAVKGGRLHRRAGWVFVGAMATVSATALLLSGSRLLFDPTPQGRDGGFFLLAITFLTANAVSTGVRVLRFKNRTTTHVHWWDTGLPAVLTLFSLALGAYGIARGQVLFIAFSLIGLLNGISVLRYWLRMPTTKMHWWFQHMGAMLGGCIAATTAFLVVNANNVGLWPMVAWLSPAIIGTPATAIWTGYYRRRFNAASSSRSHTSSAALAGDPGTL